MIWQTDAKWSKGNRAVMPYLAWRHFLLLTSFCNIAASQIIEFCFMRKRKNYQLCIVWHIIVFKVKINWIGRILSNLTSTFNINITIQNNPKIICENKFYKTSYFANESQFYFSVLGNRAKFTICRNCWILKSRLIVLKILFKFFILIMNYLSLD